jgi:hypothetical protein
MSYPDLGEMYSRLGMLYHYDVPKVNACGLVRRTRG